MTNEVNNQSEASANTETSISQETNTSPSADASAEVTPAAETQTMSAEQSTTETPAASAETSSSGEEDFGSILEKFEQEQTIYHSGELVEGTVVGVSERGVLIDFGYKSEGIAPIEDFMSPDGEVTVAKGDSVEAIIRSITSGDAPPMLSRADAVSRKSWDIIEKAFNDEAPITGRVLGVTKGGLRVDLSGVEAFLPGSQADSRPLRNLDSFVGQDIEAKIIKFSRKRNNIVLSRKVLTDEVVNAQKAETFANIGEGYIIEGTIKNLTEYGAFVDIGGIDGLLHVTDMSWGRLQNPGDQFKVGDTVQVKVLKLDRQKEKVALGFKQLIPDPWSTVMELYPINAKIQGRVSSVTDYGAFIELEPGVEGLVHVSEMSWSKRSPSPKKLVHHGDEVEVQVLGVDTVERRISLGMKQLQPNPWQTIHERYRVGQTVRGKVRNLTDFGAFVEIEDGIDGLVHVSDISHSKKIKHPKDVLKRDQEVEAVIRNIDIDNRRMSLSIKELTPSAWDSFVSIHKTGDVVRGRISRYAGFGVFVELGNDLEGLCHISELSDERIERPEDIGSIGQEMDFKILRIENDVQKIGLSARAVGKEEEPTIDTKNYSTEAKSGMASLGELMNLKRSGAPDEENKPDEPRLSKKERKALQAQERAEQERLEAERAAAEPEQNAETESAAETTSADSENTDTTEASTGGDETQSAGETETNNGEPAAVQSDETSVETLSENDSASAEIQSTNQVETEQSQESAISHSAETNTESQESRASNSNDDDVTLELGGGAQKPDTDGQATSVIESSSAADHSEDILGIGTETAVTDESNSENADASQDSEEKTANG
jgi:small subunit ribosomal protein S1